MKKLPYGISDFKAVQEEDYYLFDKTNFIPKLEQMGRYLFFIRPRRFGKSLFLSMIECYYDLKYKDNFEEIFKGTTILDNPTKERNSYHILRFDFSAIDSSRPRESMNEYCNIRLENFLHKYDLSLKFGENFMDNLNRVLTYFEETNKKIYLLLDEYDNFINKILISDQKDYEGYITDKEAIFKQFFTVLKVATGGVNAPLKKMFITGVSPMALFDVTSGYNIGMNITTNPIFNTMVGVTQGELDALIKFYNLEEMVDREVIKRWYNNYLFSEMAETTVYNTDMILYYINSFLINGYPPKELIDINVRSDYSKLRFLIYTNKKLNGNFETLQNLIYDNAVSISHIVDNFSALELTKAENFKSLMYYLGLATIESGGLKLKLKIPNETIKRIACSYIRDSLELEQIFTLNLDTFNDKLANFAQDGDLDVFHYLGERIKENSGIRDYIKGEDFVKTFCLAYLSLSNYFVARSEMELNKGFADIYLEPLNPYGTYAGLLEFKYIKRSDFSEALLAQKIGEAKEQLSRYSDDIIVKNLEKQGKKVKSVVIVFSGWEMVAVE